MHLGKKWGRVTPEERTPDTKLGTSRGKGVVARVGGGGSHKIAGAVPERKQPNSVKIDRKDAQ